MKKQFTEIPEAYKISSLLHQKTYLVNGELKEWKGDVARMLMYMYLRYGEQCLPANVTVGPRTFNNDITDILLLWNIEDPVSKRILAWWLSEIATQLKEKREKRPEKVQSRS